SRGHRTRGAARRRSDRARRRARWHTRPSASSGSGSARSRAATAQVNLVEADVDGGPPVSCLDMEPLRVGPRDEVVRARMRLSRQQPARDALLKGLQEIPRRRANRKGSVDFGRQAHVSRLPRAVEVLPPTRLRSIAEMSSHPARVRPQVAARVLGAYLGRCRLLLDLLCQVARIQVVKDAHELAEVEIRDALVAGDHQHILVVLFCEAPLKLAEPVTTVGSSLSGSSRINLSWM